MSDNFWKEVFDLVSEYDAKRQKFIKEYRLYYNNDGTIIGLWENSFPETTNYIVLDDPGVFFHTNTQLLRVKNNKLIVLDPREPNRARLKKSDQGFKVVKGNAAVVVESNENYELVEYYDRTDS
jgi:hypothetical protein